MSDSFNPAPYIGPDLDPEHRPQGTPDEYLMPEQLAKKHASSGLIPVHPIEYTPGNFVGRARCVPENPDALVEITQIAAPGYPPGMTVRHSEPIEAQKGVATRLEAREWLYGTSRHFQPTIFVIIGPSGSGKTTVINHVLDHYSVIKMPKGIWTRQPRPGEADPDSRTIPREEFLAKISRNEVVAYAEYAGELYGTERSAYTDLLDKHYCCIRAITSPGAVNLLSEMAGYRTVTIFLDCPLDELHRRLLQRHDLSLTQIQSRLDAAEEELEGRHRWRHLINATLTKEEVAQRVDHVIMAHT